MPTLADTACKFRLSLSYQRLDYEYVEEMPHKARLSRSLDDQTLAGSGNPAIVEESDEGDSLILVACVESACSHITKTFMVTL